MAPRVKVAVLYLREVREEHLLEGVKAHAASRRLSAACESISLEQEVFDVLLREGESPADKGVYEICLLDIAHAGKVKRAVCYVGSLI